MPIEIARHSRHRGARSRCSTGGAISSISRPRPAIWARWRLRSTDLDVNCRAQLSLLESCRAAAPGITIVFASTRQIYGKPDRLPVDEKHPLRPPDVNGVNKMAGEAYHLSTTRPMAWRRRRSAHQHLRAAHADQGCAPDLRRPVAAPRARGRSPSRCGAASSAATSPMSTMRSRRSCWRPRCRRREGRAFNLGGERRGEPRRAGARCWSRPMAAAVRDARAFRPSASASTSAITRPTTALFRRRHGLAAARAARRRAGPHARLFPRDISAHYV